MKKFFVLLFGLVIVILMMGCLNLEGIFPFLNQAPIVISEPIVTATEDQLYSYQVEASDPNGDILTYSFTAKPEGMSIDSESGLISWTPTNAQVGIHRVVVEIFDGKQSVTQSFEIEVFNVNNPPQILSCSPTNINIKINEGSSVKFEIQARDIDLNTVLSYQWLLNGKKVSSSTVSGDGSKSSWIYYASYGDYSQKIVKASVSDGELQDYVQWNITINDITPPTQPTLNTVTSPTNISSQTLSGTKEANSSILINDTEVVSINSSTDWSHLYNLFEGTNNISITSRDVAGNESSTVTAIIILDTINPAAPTLDAVVSPTNVSPQILSGTKEADASIWINNLEVVHINPSTTWIYDFNLSEGENDISVTSQDSAGNESGKATVKIILDAISPTVPTLNEVITPTNISIQILSGSKEASSSIWLNGTEVVPLNSSTEWSYPYNLSEGINNISITSCDAVGNECAAVKSNITLDTIPPTAPTLHNIISPTNIYTQLLSGHKEINSSIWINGVEVIPVNFETTWSYDFELIEGENSISIISKDIVGNESNEINTTVILDISAPRIPSLGHIISQTNISSQILSGTKEANSSIWINGVEVISVNSDITWSYSYILSEGTNNISITSRDVAGNESSTVTAIIILDTINPAAPTLDAVVSPTNVSPQILSGTKETNTSIWINEIKSVLINSDTTWSHIFDLSEGANKISITACDVAGNKSTTVTADITLDTIVPETPNLNPVTSPTNISSQTLSGTKEANSSILINDTEVVSINSSTDWSHLYNLFEGTNNISITSRDAAGNESPAVLMTIEYDPNIYVDEANISGIEDGTQTHPFNTITEGLIAVAPGKSVMVAAGTYNEQLIINKKITLQGASQGNTFITGSGLTENLISLEADNITISGFTIDGDSSTSVGIYFDNYSFININNNLIKNNKDYGISYINSAPIIEGNNIENNSSSGIKVATNGAGIIRNNSIVSNKHGIRTYGDSCPEINRNNISNNKTGIYCRESATPIISYNTISNNSGYGILIDNISGNLVNPDIGGGDGQSDGQNKITGNSIHGVSNKTTHNVYVKYNWWGDAAGPKYPGNPNNATILSDWAYWSKTGGDIIFTPHLTVTP